MAESEQDGWNQWGKHVIRELERLNKNIEDSNQAAHSFQVWVNRQFTDHASRFATLEVKAGIWGLAGGAVAILLVMFAERLAK